MLVFFSARIPLIWACSALGLLHLSAMSLTAVQERNCSRMCCLKLTASELRVVCVSLILRA